MLERAIVQNGNVYGDGAGGHCGAERHFRNCCKHDLSRIERNNNMKARDLTITTNTDVK